MPVPALTGGNGGMKRGDPLGCPDMGMLMAYEGSKVYGFGGAGRLCWMLGADVAAVVVDG
jgi:hypothetical protein